MSTSVITGFQSITQPSVPAVALGPLAGATPEWTVPSEQPHSPTIFIVDDEELNIRVARKYLRSWGYSQVNSTTEPADAIAWIHERRPDLVLLDVMMPDISGLDILKQLRADEVTRHLPVIVLTAHVEDEIRHQALELGANDFLGKPIDPLEMCPRVRNLLKLREHQRWLETTSVRLEGEVQRRTAALAAAEQHIAHCLARAAEYRDNDTGRHVVRVGLYAGVIARALGLGDDYALLISQAAKLHDVGKIGIPDSILLKTGKLDPSEFKVIQGHCTIGDQVITNLSDDDLQTFRRHVQIGAGILGTVNSPLLKLAAQIALTHHEKWDGTGYPFGLVGEQIPLEGRITAVADVFDALSSRRPYKPAFPLEKCYAILEEGRNKHFDPRVLDAFLTHRQEAVEIQIEHADPK